MAWTTPVEYALNQAVDHTHLNTYLRDNVHYLYLVTARQTADVTKNANTTLADLTGLSFSVLSGEVWAFAVFSYTTGSTSAGLKYSVTAPALTTGRFGVAGSGAPLSAGSTTTFGGTIDCGASATTNAIITGYITAGGDGTIQIQGAQSSSTAADTVFLTNSYLIALRVA